MTDPNCRISYLENDAMRAKALVEDFASRNWPNSPMALKVEYCPTPPSDAYYRDSRPVKEAGWFHFIVVGTYLGVGGSPLFCVNPNSGEILSAGVVGE